MADRIEIYSSVTKGLTQQFKEAALHKKLSMLEEVSKVGFGWTPLHFASHYGHADILRFLIEFFADCEERYKVFNM